MKLEFYSAGKLTSLVLQPLRSLQDKVLSKPAAFASRVTPVSGMRARAAGGAKRSAARKTARAPAKAGEIAKRYAGMLEQAAEVVHTQAARNQLFNDPHETQLTVVSPTPGREVTLPTHTVIVAGAKKADLKWMRDKFGMEVVREGLQDKFLLKVPLAGDKGFELAAEAAIKCHEERHVEAAHPNFLRFFGQVRRGTPTAKHRVIESTTEISGSETPVPPADSANPPAGSAKEPLWNHDNAGKPGIPGADVAAHAAWILSRGDADIRVAVLDEGVDTDHPALKAAVVA
jgi:hypothetical protein